MFKRKGFAVHDAYSWPVCTAGCCLLVFLQQGVDQCVCKHLRVQPHLRSEKDVILFGEEKSMKDPLL